MSADSTQRAFPSTDVEAFMKRVMKTFPIDPFDSRMNTSHVVVSVDPAGGGSSQFAICSIVQLPNGSIMVSHNCQASLLPTFPS